MQDDIVLEDLEIYKLVLEIGENVWDIVAAWEHFPQKTIGSQFVETANSIAGNTV